MNITKITVGRLYNLGSYEHVRYELTVEIKEGELAATALTGIERIFAALNPSTSGVEKEYEIRNNANRVARMKELLEQKGEEEFRGQYNYFEGTPEEYIARCEQGVADSRAKRAAWEARSRKARELLDDLGGAARWRDAKLDWDNDF
jgi:hypothetical protein